MLNMQAQLNAYIQSGDAKTQAGFYAQALGGEIVSVMTLGQLPGTPEEQRDKVMHLVLSVAGGNVLFLADSNGLAGGGRSISLSLSFGDLEQARQAFANLSEGGTVRYPFEQQPWGAHYGELEDRFGVNWMIVNP
jgi:PhnB protein